MTSDLRAHVQVGMPITELLLPESCVRCQRFLLLAARHGASVDCELSVRSPDGARALRFIALRLAHDALLVVAAREAEALLCLLGAACHPQQRAAERGRLVDPQRALDELSRVNSELVNSQRELAKEHAVTRARARQRQEMLATVAHDLRTPMAAVLGYCELLGQASGSSADSIGPLIPRVCATVRYALNLLSQTLDYARADSGRLTLRLAQTDLRELTSTVIEMHRVLAADKGIHIELLGGSEALPPIWIDPVLIQQTIGNLLTNAIKYSPRDTKIEVRLAGHDGEVSVSVRDQGLGIEPAFLPLIFRPFQTTSTKSTAGEKSTGLGLAIVQKLVEAHGGKIDVQSTPHQGSTFVVRLPVKPRDDAPSVTVLGELDSEHGAGGESGVERSP